MQFTKYLKTKENRIWGFCVVWDEEVIYQLHMKYVFAIMIAINAHRFDSWHPLICWKKKCK